VVPPQVRPLSQHLARSRSASRCWRARRAPELRGAGRCCRRGRGATGAARPSAAPSPRRTLRRPTSSCRCSSTTASRTCRSRPCPAWTAWAGATGCWTRSRRRAPWASTASCCSPRRAPARALGQAAWPLRAVGRVDVPQPGRAWWHVAAREPGGLSRTRRCAARTQRAARLPARAAPVAPRARGLTAAPMRPADAGAPEDADRRGGVQPGRPGAARHPPAEGHVPGRGGARGAGAASARPGRAASVCPSGRRPSRGLPAALCACTACTMGPPVRLACSRRSAAAARPAGGSLACPACAMGPPVRLARSRRSVATAYAHPLRLGRGRGPVGRCTRAPLHRAHRRGSGPRCGPAGTQPQLGLARARARAGVHRACPKPYPMRRYTPTSRWTRTTAMGMTASCATTASS